MRVRILLAVAMTVLLGTVAPAESWNQIPAPDSPAAKYGHSMVTLDDGRVLVFGGEDYRGDLQNSICGFRAEAQAWEPLSTTNSPPARLWATLTQISDHEVALFGGMGEAGEVLNDLYILDLDTNEWHEVKVTTPPPPRKLHVAFYYNGTLYVAGGVGGDGRPRRDLWGYEFKSGTWTQGPDAPEEFWGAYATVYCGSPCSAYILGPVTLAYDLMKGEWRRLKTQGDEPPPKHLAAFAREDGLVHMIGGLYIGGGKVFSTPCHFSYDLAGGTWIYHNALSAPFQDTGLWGAQAFWSTGALWVSGGIQGWDAALSLDALLGPGPLAITDPLKVNDKVYVWRKEGGPGGVPRAQPPGQVRGPGGRVRPPGEEPKEPEEPDTPYPNLVDCAVTHGLDEQGIPVDREPVFSAADRLATWWLKISPLCEQVSIRVEIYNAQGYLHETYTATSPNPAEYGVTCLKSYTSSSGITLGDPKIRPEGTWWMEIYIDDGLSCTLLFEVEG